jgi:hypothetical protein
MKRESFPNRARTQAEVLQCDHRDRGVTAARRAIPHSQPGQAGSLGTHQESFAAPGGHRRAEQVDGELIQIRELGSRWRRTSARRLA